MVSEITLSLVSTVTVGAGGAASIAFSSIAGTATDLLLVVSARTDTAGANDGVIVRFNGDTTAANYTYRRLIGDGASASSASGNNFFAGWASSSANTANTFGNSQIYIPNYAGSAAKTASSDGVSENNAATAYQGIFANSWTGTAAITTVTLTPQFGTLFAQYSTASLYTITKGSGGATVA